MAESKYKGLLYSPEVLGGIGLLTAGLSGGSPDKALPSLLQGMQTAAMFRKQEDEDEKQKLIKEYADQVPPDMKNEFLIAPKKYLDKYVFGKDKKPNLVTYKDLISGEVKAFDISKKSEQILLEEFRKEKDRNVVQAPSMDKSSDLIPKSNKTELTKTIVKGTDLLSNLNRQEILYEEEFLSAKGKVYFEFLKKKDQAASLTGIQLTNDERGFLNRRSTWLQTNQQYFNDYRKAVTGVAAGEKEIGWIQESIPSDKDTPSTYSAKLKNQKIIQQKLIDNAQQFLKTKGKPAMDGNGEYTKEYLDYIKGKVKPSGEILENLMIGYKKDGYKSDAIIALMNDQYKGINWEEIFKTYQNAKSGGAL